jgi:hypothetical protein
MHPRNEILEPREGSRPPLRVRKTTAQRLRSASLDPAQGAVVDAPVPVTVNDDKTYGPRPDQPFRRRQGLGFSTRADDGNGGEIDSTPEKVRGKENGICSGHPGHRFILALGVCDDLGHIAHGSGGLRFGELSQDPDQIGETP